MCQRVQVETFLFFWVWGVDPCMFGKSLTDTWLNGATARKTSISWDFVTLFSVLLFFTSSVTLPSGQLHSTDIWLRGTTFIFLSRETFKQRNKTIYPLTGQAGSLVMTQEKINTLTGCPQGRERDLSSRAISTCTSFLAPSLQELLKAPSAPMWDWPISLSYWVNRDKSNAAKHQRPGGQRKNRSQLVLLTETGAWLLCFTDKHRHHDAALQH